MKKLLFLFLRLIFLGIITNVFIYTTVLSAQVQEIKPIDQEITITDLVIKEDQEALKVDIVFPLVQGIKDDKRVEEKINQIIQKDILNFKNLLQAESEDYLQLARSEGWETRKYIEDGMVIYFGLYEITSYASGIRYFKIFYSSFGNS